MFWILRGSESKFFFIDDGDIEMNQRTPAACQDQISKMCDVVSALKEGDILRVELKETPFDDLFQGKLRRFVSLHTEERVIEFDDQSMLLIALLINDRQWGKVRMLTLRVKQGFCPGVFIAMLIGRGYLESVELQSPA